MKYTKILTIQELNRLIPYTSDVLYKSEEFKALVNKRFINHTPLHRLIAHEYREKFPNKEIPNFLKKYLLV